MSRCQAWDECVLDMRRLGAFALGSFVVGVTVLFAIQHFGGEPPPDTSPAVAPTVRLANTFPLLSELRVSLFRDMSWCQSIRYRDGQFSRTESPFTCNLSDDAVGAFDARALQAYLRIKEGLRATGLEIFDVYGHLDAGGRILDMEFVSAQNASGVCLKPCSEVVFEFKPGHQRTHDIFEGVETFPIDRDWYREVHY